MECNCLASTIKKYKKLFFIIETDSAKEQIR